MLAFAPLHGAVGAAATAVAWLADTLHPLTGGAATAAAIVLFTVAVRLLISPLTVAQVRGERRRAALAPQVRDLRHRYADDPARLQAELFALYRSAGASPVAGCLPTLLQAPFFLVMYRLFSTDEGGAGLLAERLAGVPLGWHLSDGLAGAAGPLFGALLAALVALAWWSSRRARRAAAAGGMLAGAAAA
ncbi:membrane protein insertase YidC, partial [Micromonospora sp. B11E3]|uniref:YidC/Oxa1 family membrane protein insertase n=1 Tax=Micromonospora sp. B11E3 TaxID=3153562 RepID=UPI00325F74E4